jgi:hypothetical protein
MNATIPQLNDQFDLLLPLEQAATRLPTPQRLIPL